MAEWQEGNDTMGKRARRHDRLRDLAVERLRHPSDVGNADICRRIPALMAERLNAPVSVRFVDTHSPGITGGTALRSDGSYIVLCVKSRSWYHRLAILLHELSHVLLEHKPVELRSEDGLRRFLPHLPPTMITFIAGRTNLTPKEERDAEELADCILAELSDAAHEPQHAELLSELPEHVRRIADALEDHHRQGSP